GPLERAHILGHGFVGHGRRDGVAGGGIGRGHGIESKAGTGNGEQGTVKSRAPDTKTAPFPEPFCHRDRRTTVPRSPFPASVSRRPSTGRRRRPPRRRPTPAPRAPCARARPCPR